MVGASEPDYRARADLIRRWCQGSGLTVEEVERSGSLVRVFGNWPTPILVMILEHSVRDLNRVGRGRVIANALAIDRPSNLTLTERRKNYIIEQEAKGLKSSHRTLTRHEQAEATELARYFDVTAERNRALELPDERVSDEDPVSLADVLGPNRPNLEDRHLRQQVSKAMKPSIEEILDRLKDLSDRLSIVQDEVSASAARIDEQGTAFSAIEKSLKQILSQAPQDYFIARDHQYDSPRSQPPRQEPYPPPSTSFPAPYPPNYDPS